MNALKKSLLAAIVVTAVGATPALVKAQQLDVNSQAISLAIEALKDDQPGLLNYLNSQVRANPRIAPLLARLSVQASPQSSVEVVSTIAQALAGFGDPAVATRVVGAVVAAVTPEVAPSEVVDVATAAARAFGAEGAAEIVAVVRAISGQDVISEVAQATGSSETEIESDVASVSVDEIINQTNNNTGATNDNTGATNDNAGAGDTIFGNGDGDGVNDVVTPIEQVASPN
ncbi:hypothetical protein [Terasakiella pusilla]|uniref:hypothetical protein n=1 Tax=Terasakiella pusilla TaxID=64973 RepID=UPI003AA84CCD